jgi:hypothetical protein
MAIDRTSASLFGVRTVDPRHGPDNAVNGRVDNLGGAHTPSSRPTCPRQLAWLIPEPGVRACVRVQGRGGDHRDAAGYPWNDQRWSD